MTHAILTPLVQAVRRRPQIAIGFGIVAIALLLALLAPVIATHEPNAIALRAKLQAPSALHWLGTDEFGRDLFSRILHGARLSLLLSLTLVLATLSVGALLGGLSGLLAGWFDLVLMRALDIVMAIPPLVLALALAAALGPSLFNALLALGLVRLPAYIRLVRAQSLSLRGAGYVDYARLSGAGTWHVLRRHIVPNGIGPILVQATLDMGSVILAAAALSFIGLGAQPPTAEWGAIIGGGRPYFLSHWWYTLFPGLAIVVTALGFNLLGDGLRDLLDPRDVP